MIRLLAPAKVNLYLHVLGQRPDGFHELETLFERISLADELTLEPAEHRITLYCNDPSLTVGPDNLILRAAALLQETKSTKMGATISLVKQIPIASGLGGGSSDAAATLVALNQLWKLKLPPAKLRELAAQLGSDVPFFLEPSAFAIGRGRGERCEVVSGRMPSLWHVLVVPPERLSTKDVYADFAAQRRAGATQTALTPETPSITMCLHALRNGSLGELAKGLLNDLEPVAIRRCPVIHGIHAFLRNNGCLASLLSGSGSAVFGLFETEALAINAAKRLRIDHAEWFVRVVTTWTSHEE